MTGLLDVVRVLGVVMLAVVVAGGLLAYGGRP